MRPLPCGQQLDSGQMRLKSLNLRIPLSNAKMESVRPSIVLRVVMERQMTTGSANSFASARLRVHAIHFTLVLLSFFAGRCMPALAQDRADFPVNPQHLVYHDVRTDASGAIVPWSSDRPSVAYDHDIRLLWKFWHEMRTCGPGIPYYLQHQVWKEKEDDPRGLGGDQINMAIDSWNLLYGYLGDPALHEHGHDGQLLARPWHVGSESSIRQHALSL